MRQLELLEDAERRVPDDAYIVDGVPTFITTMTTRKVLYWDLFLAGDRPMKIALFKGLHWQSYKELAAKINAEAQKYYNCQNAAAVPVFDGPPLELDLCTHK